MVWQDQLRADARTWLLEDSEPGVRYLSLRDLKGDAGEDAEVDVARRAAHHAGPIAAILAQMDEEGYWTQPGPGYLPKYRSTVWAMILLAQLGARIEEDQRIRRACAYVLDHALAPQGQFTTSGAPSGTADCVQGNLCWALSELGCRDPRLEVAFDWLARSVTGEGIAPQEDRQATLRYYAGKCGPGFACGANNRQACAWGGVKVMLALGSRPAVRRTPLMERAIDQGVDFFLRTDPATAGYPSGWSERPSGSWWKFGFPVFYVTDVLQIGEALAALGYATDPRMASLLRLIREKQDGQGRWAMEYSYTGKTLADFGPTKQPNKWVTLRALRVLQAGAA